MLPWGSNAEAIDFGMDMAAIAPYLGSLVNQDHTEQLGRENENFELRKRWLATNRELIGPEMHYVTGIAPRMAASAELVREGIALVRRENIEVICGLGGGSVIDSAKAIGAGSVVQDR